MSKIFFSIFFKTNLSAFRAAILANDTNRICRILDIERKHICKELDDEGNTALLLAIKYASPLTVCVLLEQGAHPDKSNCLDFQTPLSSLAARGYENTQSHEAKIALEMAMILLDHGAYIDKLSPYTLTDEDGESYSIKETPLMTAVRTKNLPMATLFVERKAHVNYVDKETQNRPIHYCITNGDAAMFDLLENAGASCRSVITNGDNTLLHWFCYNKLNDEHISLLKKLINKGCDINAENNLQRTPLMLAASLDMINTCHTLLNASADLEIVDYQGNCAIDLAPSDSECFRLLKQQRKRQINARENPSIDRILWRQKITSTHSLFQQINDSRNSLNRNDNHIEYYSASALETELSNEFDTKYKRMWEKLLQTKEKIRGSRDSNITRSRDRSQSRKKDPSQSRASDFFINLKL